MGRNENQARPDANTATAVVEVKHRLSAVRGLRDGLVKLALMLAEHPKKQGYLLLMDTRLSLPCLTGETDGLKAAMRPDIADRLNLVVVKAGQIVQKPSNVPAADLELLQRCIVESVDSRTALRTPDKQEEVFLVILYQWVIGQGPMTSRWLEETVGCNYRTVSATIDRLESAIRRYSDRRISLKYFPDREWKRFLAVAHKSRATMLYADPSDQPRSPESLLGRLPRLGRADIAVGGVLGAKRYAPDLDIVGAPRLDLCVHAPGTHVDLDFVQQLDPALERTRDRHRPARVALHFIRRQGALFDRDDSGSLWADPVECLLELYSARLDLQAASFQEFLELRGRELSGKADR
jgi:hypothetical protein